jgi:hypothetical protein
MMRKQVNFGFMSRRFYAIYEVEKASVEVYELVGNRYRRLRENDRGHYAIPPLGVELGIWRGTVSNQTLPWLRWWDHDGNLLLSSDERADREKQRADRLAMKLRELGIDPEGIDPEAL